LPESSDPFLPRIRDILKSEILALQEFVSLLAQEQVALTEGRTENLPSFSEQKSALAVRINSLAGERDSIMGRIGLPPGKQGVESLIDSLVKDRTSFETLWSKVSSLAIEARELNRLNGELIGIRMQHNSKALEVLLGSQASLDLYGPDGQSTRPGGRRIIDAV
jgi:flagellar biosynthesis protein FlgN